MAGFDSAPRPVKTWHSKSYDHIDPKRSRFDGKGKTVLITAGATGIGFSIAKSFAETGVERIVILSRSPGPQQEAKSVLNSLYPGLKVLPYQVSITDHGRVNSILKDIEKIDVLVMSATATEPGFGGSNLDVSVDDMQLIFDTNVIAAFNLVQTYLSLPEPVGRRKTIINVSSLASHIVLPGQVGYGPSKAAVTQIFDHFAKELDPTKTTLLSYHPGALYTAKAASYDIKDKFDWDDIELPGHFAVWLASPEALFLHGRMVWSNWDAAELAALREKVECDPNYLTIGLQQ